MARPKRGNYATGEAGLARYKEALRKYLAKTKKTEVKKPEVKKPVAKKPVAKKPATKKPAAKKPVAKKPPVKKPVAKKPVAKKPATTTRPKRTANQLKIKKAATTAQKAIKKATPVVKKAASTVKKKAGEAKQAVDKKVTSVKKAIKKYKAPAPKTAAQKAVSKVTKGAKKYGGKVLKKGGKDLLKIGKGIVKNPGSAVAGLKGAGAAYLAEKGINQLTDRAFKQLRKSTRGKNMTLAEYRANKDKAVKESRKKYGIVPTAKKLVNKIRGKSGDSPITKKTISKAPNRTEKQKSDLQIAKDRAKKAKGYNKEKLQREVRYQEKFGKQGRTWSNPVGAEGKGKPTSVKTDKKSTPTKKYGRAPKGYIKSGTKFVPIRSAKGKQALNRQRARERAQAAARERLRKKKQNQ